MINKETLENVKIVQKSYDEAPYKSKTFYYTQPGRQQMVLKLLGFKTPDLEKARVYLNWEIGMEDRIAIVTDIKQTEWDGRNPNEG